MDRHRILERECSHLRRQLAERDDQVRQLDGRIREMNQTRKDAAKRVDDLLAQLDRLEERLRPEARAARGGE